MSVIIELREQVSRKRVEEDLKASFPDNFVKTSVFGNIILHEDSRIFALIHVHGNRVIVRAGHRWRDFLVLLIGGSLGTTPTAVGAFAEIRESKQETEQKYANWITEKHQVT